MTPELQNALGVLALAAIGGLTILIRVWTDQIKTRLDHNTTITNRVESQTNGQLAQLRDEVQRWRAVSERKALLVREQRWLIMQLQANPEARRVIDEIMQEYRVVVHDSDYEDLEQRLRRSLPSKHDTPPHGSAR